MDPLRADLMFTVGDFNTTQLPNFNPTSGVHRCLALERGISGRADAIFVRAAPTASINLDQCRAGNLQSDASAPSLPSVHLWQHELRDQYRSKKDGNTYTQSITDHPSDHFPLTMNLTYQKDHRSCSLGLLTWNVMTQGITPDYVDGGNERRWNKTGEHTMIEDQINDMLNVLDKLFNNAKNQGIPIVCLQEYGGGAKGKNWNEFLRPQKLNNSQKFDSQKFVMGLRTLRTPSADPASLSSLINHPPDGDEDKDVWLCFSTHVGKVTFILAEALDIELIEERQRSNSNMEQLYISVGSNGDEHNDLEKAIKGENNLEPERWLPATSCQLPFKINDVALTIRITNVHDVLALNNDPQIRAQGMTHNAITRSLSEYLLPQAHHGWVSVSSGRGRGKGSGRGRGSRRGRGRGHGSGSRGRGKGRGRGRGRGRGSTSRGHGKGSRGRGSWGGGVRTRRRRQTTTTRRRATRIKG